MDDGDDDDLGFRAQQLVWLYSALPIIPDGDSVESTSCFHVN